jgi:hypothetical protein
MLTLVGAPLAGARLGGRKARPYKTYVQFVSS